MANYNLSGDVMAQGYVGHAELLLEAAREIVRKVGIPEGSLVRVKQLTRCAAEQLALASGTRDEDVLERIVHVLQPTKYALGTSIDQGWLIGWMVRPGYGKGGYEGLCDKLERVLNAEMRSVLPGELQQAFTDQPGRDAYPFE